MLNIKEFDDSRRAPALSCNPTGTKITCEPAFAPPITYSLASDYAIPLGGAGTLTLGGDLRFVDKHFLSVDNRTNLMENGYMLVNAFAQYDLPGGNYYVRAGVKNLTKVGVPHRRPGILQHRQYPDRLLWRSADLDHHGGLPLLTFAKF